MTAEPALPVIDELQELVEMAVQVPGLYLRYSDGPLADAAGPSRDYEAEIVLPGLSVTVLTPEPWWSRPAADWVARRVCKYSNLARDDSRRPWVLTGTVVGNGPDHEPLIVDPVPVAWVGDRAVAQAHDRYRQRFLVGRDST